MYSNKNVQPSLEQESWDTMGLNHFDSVNHLFVCKGYLLCYINNIIGVHKY